MKRAIITAALGIAAAFLQTIARAEVDASWAQKWISSLRTGDTAHDRK